ncbi:hypothetical protein ERD95_17530 [Enterobacteriaceae bacterium ML5]|nr:hypothetical protein ERD95_17530 [Enterobacteriaceae bacterium ML5]
MPTSDDINNQAYTTFYSKAFTDSGYGTGGKYPMAAQAATAAIQGLAGGDLAKAIAGGSGGRCRLSGTRLQDWR